MILYKMHGFKKTLQTYVNRLSFDRISDKRKLPRDITCFKFLLPSELLEKRRLKFQINFIQCTGVLQYFGIKT